MNLQRMDNIDLAEVREVVSALYYIDREKPMILLMGGGFPAAK